mmetsp:Transcript_115916/g.322771  ORF Transcript_115916/g.322771 Transcript_115916/m.322771 type:complete len:247 (-) Transcript_115916:645-1385(-)
MANSCLHRPTHSQLSPVRFLLVVRIRPRPVEPVPTVGGEVCEQVRKHLALETHGASMCDPRSLVEYHLSRLEVHLFEPLPVRMDHLQRPALVGILAHLQHGAGNVRLLAVQVVHKHRVATVDANAKGRAVLEPHLCPPLEDLLHLVDNHLHHSWVLGELDLVELDNVIVAEPTRDHPVTDDRILQPLLVPGVQGLLDAVGHLHLEVAALIVSDVHDEPLLIREQVILGLANLVCACPRLALVEAIG